MSKLIGTAPNQVPSNADLGTMAYLDTAQANKILSAGRRNLLHNANFEVNQYARVYPFTTTAGYHTFVCDRWGSYGNGQATDVTISEVTLPDGSTCNSLKTVSGLTNPGNSWLHPVQYIEWNNAYRNKSIVYSAWVRTNIPNHKFRWCDGNSCYTIGDEITADGEWHYVWAKTTVPSTATALSWQVFISQTTHMQSGDYLEIAQPQLEFGEYPTPFDYRPFGEELALCQRYYQVRYVLGSGVQNSSTQALVSVQLPTAMRETPSISTKSGVWTNINVENDDTYDVTGVVIAHGVTVGSTNPDDTSSFIATVTTSGTNTVGYGVCVMCDRNGDWFIFDAEL